MHMVHSQVSEVTFWRTAILLLPSQTIFGPLIQNCDTQQSKGGNNLPIKPTQTQNILCFLISP